MINKNFALLTGTLFFYIGFVSAQDLGDKGAGNAAAGKLKSQTCIACHGNDGNSTVPNWPKIAGQYESYTTKQLKEFKMGEKGPRFEPTMAGMTANLSDQDILDLAAFYAQQKQSFGQAQGEYVALGEKIYRGGNIKTGLVACAACHGPEGQGNELAKFPRLAGQHALYVENQLKAFRQGSRKNSPNGMMEVESHYMSDEEIKAVSSFVEGLRPQLETKKEIK
jgi:cytochrome c553